MIRKNRHGANHNGLGIVDLMKLNGFMFNVVVHLIQHDCFWLAKKILDIE
jgi:hypothetical protein